MSTRIKVVPEDTPNADGEWIKVEIDLPATTRWKVAEVILAPYIPKGHVLVAMEGDRRANV